MRVEHLSTYATDQLLASRQAERAAHASQTAAELASLEAEARVARARSSKSVWRRLLGVASTEEKAARVDQQQAVHRAAQAAAETAQASIQVSQRSKGERGEQALLAALAQLGDDWIAFTGYQTKAGEADVVLVGPDGVWVIEVKTRRVRLTIAGPDRWYIDKLSASGRSQGQDVATDGGGRVWGRQASDAADALGRWLERQGHTVAIRSAVMLMDPMAEIVVHGDAGVDLVSARPPDLLVTVRIRATPLTADQRRAIEGLIRRDHAHTTKRRAERRSGGPPPQRSRRSVSGPRAARHP